MIQNHTDGEKLWQQLHSKLRGIQYAQAVPWFPLGLWCALLEVDWLCDYWLCSCDGEAGQADRRVLCGLTVLLPQSPLLRLYLPTTLTLTNSSSFTSDKCFSSMNKNYKSKIRAIPLGFSIEEQPLALIKCLLMWTEQKLNTAVRQETSLGGVRGFEPCQIKSDSSWKGRVPDFFKMK